MGYGLARGVDKLAGQKVRCREFQKEFFPRPFYDSMRKRWAVTRSSSGGYHSLAGFGDKCEAPHGVSG